MQKFASFVALLIIAACSPSVPPTDMEITSPVFEHNGSIPSKYTCDGEDINPPLVFSGVSEETQSLVLLMDDPDVPKSIRPDGMWDHWVVYSIPSDTTSIDENSSPPGSVGKNTSGETKYGGPCPPDREHRYFFKLYALDTDVDFYESPTKAQVEEVMEGHILAQAELIGLYERQ